MKEENKNKLQDLAKKINVEVTKSQIEKYEEYINLLLEWNEKINLTAITEENDIVIKHIIDSITVLKYIENKNIIDVGTGAGFPGIPLAIQDKNAKITLLDSLNKRINFLNNVKEKLELNNIDTIHGRAEDIGQNKEYREQYDACVSRAVANMSTLVEYLIPLVKVGGIIICMKGSDIEEELNDAKTAISKLGGEIDKIDKITLPGTDIIRNIIIIKKVKQTSSTYPRKAGTPSKNPIK